MQNWKNTIDLLTAAQTRLKRVKEHVENTEKQHLKDNVDYTIIAIENIKRDLKKRRLTIMIKVSNIEVFNFKGALRGMRNPLNSWHRSDSCLCDKNNDDCLVDNPCGCPKDGDFDEPYFCIGANDLALMKALYKGGTEHRKYLRQIFVSMDVLAPLYWWKEADQYRINVTTNSCSTMHKIHAKEFTLDDFSLEHIDLLKIERLGYYPFNHVIEDVIKTLNIAREEYLRTKDKTYWWQMIQLLPSSYNQKRTVTMNYENVMNMINQRSNHKLDEWRSFVEVLKGLPYVRAIRGEL